MDKITIIDFYADWCNPCKTIAPIIEKIEADNKNIEVVKVDVDASPETTQKYGIRNIPAIIFEKGGEEVKRMIGAKSYSEYLDVIQELNG